VYACAEREGEVVLVFAKLDFAHDDIAEISSLTCISAMHPDHCNPRRIEAPDSKILPNPWTRPLWIVASASIAQGGKHIVNLCVVAIINLQLGILVRSWQ
jgi:hypothetical protein